ncbi:MAG: protein kinase [Kofleriaceae bacterium]|nr:protein kinase [Kofleriaceae bacterium]
MSDRDDATLPDPEQLTTRDSARYGDLGPRYELREVIGRGGMGEVRLARDTKIEREVAVKLMRSSGNEASVGRFLREAHVQGVLDHPAVVPVHDLGNDRNGNPYFVMKRLAGTTLADVLASDDPGMRARWSRRQLLQRLVDICLAIEFAHTRGVIHRDLKPANIMLGDFGEAYVLDWGLARLSITRDSHPQIAPLSGENVRGAVSGESYEETRAGDLLGTPGYMSPEQARGDTVDWRTDVYSLGCVLFEILVGKPALPRGLEGLAVTLSTPCHRPANHAADVAPELDALCARATALDPHARLTARQLADGIQAYLDGDRDVARRRELADEHARAAREAMASPSDAARATAVREAGRALALDPNHENAQRILGQLLIKAPAQLPAEAMLAADEERAEGRRAVFMQARYGFATLIGLTMGTLVLPLRHYWPSVSLSVLAVIAWLISEHLARHRVHGRSGWFVALFSTCIGMLGLAGIMFGPVLVLPLFVVGALAGFLSQPSDFHWRVPFVGLTLPLALVLLLELVGVLPPSVDFVDGSLVITPYVVRMTPTTATLVMGSAVITQVINTVFIGASTQRIQREAQNQVHSQTWHLKQLLPHAVERAPQTPKAGSRQA